MAEIIEIDLPGIGKKFTLTTVAGYTITVIAHLDGRRDIYYLKDSEDEDSAHVFSLTDEESRRLSAILGDTFFKPAPIDLLRSALAPTTQIELVRVPSGGPAVGKTLGELDLRRQTGASVLAVQRGDRIVPNPSAGTRVDGGDVLIVMGTAEELKKVETLLGRG
ncbi:MAG: TrkA C-terminal domain-containing protein [Thermoplasmata archaeon]